MNMRLVLVLARASETGVGKNNKKNADFRPINRYISETIEDRHIVFHCNCGSIFLNFWDFTIRQTTNGRTTDGCWQPSHHPIITVHYSDTGNELGLFYNNSARDPHAEMPLQCVFWQTVVSSARLSADQKTDTATIHHHTLRGPATFLRC